MTAKNEVGRPTIFEQSVLDKAKEYIFFFQLSEEAKANLKDSKINPTEVIPSVSGLALYLGIARSTIQEWEKDKDHEFSGTLEHLKSVQEVLLLNSGLQGKFNAQITKLALSNHGYSDKQEIDHQSSDGSMTPTRTAQDLTDDELAAIATANNTKRGG